jgi:transferase CAF17, mitochondrial
MNADQPTTLLADIDSLSLPNALQLLKRYRLRQQIDIEDVSDQYSVWVQYGNKNCADNSNNNNNSMSDDKALLAFTEQWHNDPRLAALGRRAILDRSIQFTSSSNNIIGSKQQYQEWRYMHGVAEGSLEITPNQAISLEYSIDGLNGISFTKGCYIGQELMARTHYKGVVRKRVVPFEIVGGNDSNSSEEEEGDCKRRYRDVVRVGSGEKVGKVVQVCDKYGLALLQLRKVMKEGLGGGEEGGGCMLNMTNVGEDGVQPVAIRAYRPEWWPESWGREEQ